MTRPASDLTYYYTTTIIAKSGLRWPSGVVVVDRMNCGDTLHAKPHCVKWIGWNFVIPRRRRLEKLNNNSQNEMKLKSACAWWCHAPFVIRRIWQWRELIKAGLGKVVVGVDIIVGQVQKVFSFYLIITFGDRFIIPQGGLIIIIIIRYYRSGTSTADE